MNYTLYYFTGTGNTARVVAIVQSELETVGHQVSVELITPHTPLPEAGSYDVLLLFFPAYAWAPPVLVQKFIRHLRGRRPRSAAPPSQGGPDSAQRPKAAVCVIDGGGSFQCADQTQRMLTRRGFDVVATARAGYADNWRQMTNPPSAEEGLSLNPSGDVQVREFIRQVLNGERKYYHTGIGHTLWTRAVAWIFKWLGRPLLATFYFADSDCISCGLCAEACPVGAIRMKPVSMTFFRSGTRRAAGTANRAVQIPEWNITCESCNRCINICPVNAINTSIARIGIAVLLVALSIWTLFFAWDALISRLPAGARSFPGSSLLIAGIKIGLIITAHQIGAALMKPVTSILNKIPPLRRLMQVSFNKQFNRYTAEGFKARQHV